MIEEIKKGELLKRIREILKEFRESLNASEPIEEIKKLSERVGLSIKSEYTDVVDKMLLSLFTLLSTVDTNSNTHSTLDTDALVKLTACQLLLDLKITLYVSDSDRIKAYKDSYRIIGNALDDIVDWLCPAILSGKISSTAIIFLRCFENYLVTLFENGHPNRKYKGNFSDKLIDKINKS